MNALGRSRPHGSLPRLAWEHPEWWALTLAILSWGVMVTHAIQHGAHAHHHIMKTPAETVHWLLMIVAMMLPLQLDPLRTVAFRSYRSRRQVALIAFLAGYLAVWLMAGVPVVWLRAFSWTHAHLPAAVAFAFAALWSLSSMHESALAACNRRRPLAPTGWKALRDAVNYGARVGWACVVTCWPLMLACTLTGHSLVAMVGGGMVGGMDRLSFRPSKRAIALVTLALATWHVALALVRR